MTRLSLARCSEGQYMSVRPSILAMLGCCACSMSASAFRDRPRTLRSALSGISANNWW